MSKKLRWMPAKTRFFDTLAARTVYGLSLAPLVRAGCARLRRRRIGAPGEHTKCTQHARATTLDFRRPIFARLLLTPFDARDDDCRCFRTICVPAFSANIMRAYSAPRTEGGPPAKHFSDYH